MIFKGPTAWRRTLALLSAIAHARSSMRVDSDTDRRVRYLMLVFDVALLAQILLLIGATAALLGSILSGHDALGVLVVFALTGGYAIERLTMWPVLEEVATLYSTASLEHRPGSVAR